MLDGLRLVWSLGYRKLWLELDLAEDLALIEHGCPRSNLNYLLVEAIKEEVLKEEWTIKWSQICREMNRVADWLAKDGLKRTTGLNILHFPSDGCLPLLKNDLEEFSSNV